MNSFTCTTCSFKTNKQWLLKRHFEKNTSCKQIQHQINYNSQIELLKLENDKLKQQLRQFQLNHIRLCKKLNIISDIDDTHFTIFHFNDLTSTEITEITQKNTEFILQYLYPTHYIQHFSTHDYTQLHQYLLQPLYSHMAQPSDSNSTTGDST